MTTTAPLPPATSPPSPRSPRSSDGDGGGTLSMFAAMTAVVAFLFAALGLVVVSMKDDGASSTASATPTIVEVTLTEFAISPEMIEAPTGPVTLKIKNAGSAAHNFSIASLNKKTADIQPGASATLDLGDVKAGNYDVLCEIAGHADSGMKGMLMVGSSSSAPSSSSGSTDDASSSAAHASGEMTAADMAAMNTRMEEGMKDGLETFTKGNATKGVGNQKLEPTIEPDGTKVFNLTSAIVDWEVSPGKTVKAWAYNGMVPGPWIRTEPGDHVKVVITNDLPVDTDIHFHGISVPFEMDGVSPLTQDFVRPGGTFTYDWVNADHPELGMYHAHMMGNEAVVNGMFAVFQVGDVVLPRGRTVSDVTIPADLKVTQELPMVLNDAGVIGLSLNGKSYPATAPIVADPGDAVLIHYYNEGLLSHPMHLHRMPQLVVAKDGFALEQPYWADTLNIAPGERYSVLVLPGLDDVGVWAYHCHILNHAEGPDGLMGMVTAMIVNDPAKTS